jgi:hypothetical protein
VEDAYLGCGCDVGARETDVWSPGDVANPVNVSLQNLLLDPRLVVFPAVTVSCMQLRKESSYSPKAPDFYEIIATSTRESLYRAGGRSCVSLVGDGRTGSWGDQGAREGSRCPGYRIASDVVSVEDIRAPSAIV